MKHLKWVLLSTLFILIVALLQYYVTGIPGRLVFWPLLAYVELCYFLGLKKRTKVF